MTHPRLGFIGIGLMGDPMTRRLLAAGFTVTVWNRSPGKTAGVAAAGARVADSIEALMAEVDVVLLCLANTAVVDEVVFGEDGVAAHARPGQRLIDLSSSDPAATRDLAARLEREAGMRWVDAPVSGGVAGAGRAASPSCAVARPRTWKRAARCWRPFPHASPTWARWAPAK